MNRNQAVEKIFKAKRLLSYLALTVIREKKKKGYSKFNTLYIEFSVILKYIILELDFKINEISFQRLIESLNELNNFITCNKLCINNTYIVLENDKSFNLSSNSFFALFDTFQSSVDYSGFLLKVSSDGKRIIPVADTKQDKPNQIIPSVTIVYSSTGLGSLTSPPVTGIINGLNVSKTTPTVFTPIPLSASGLQRYINCYLTNINTVIKVESVEQEVAIFPTAPINTAFIGSALVGDVAVTFPVIDLSTYALKQDLVNIEPIKANTSGTSSTYTATSTQSRTNGYFDKLEILLTVHTPNSVVNPTLVVQTANATSPVLTIKNFKGENLEIGQFAGSCTLRYYNDGITTHHFRLISGSSDRVVQLIKNQTNLLPDGLGNWYLPWLDNTGQPIADVDVMPLSVTVNGITQPPFQLNRNFTPARMYGFSDTIYPQNIKIYISKNVTSTLNTVAFQNITGFTGTSTQVIKGDGSLGSFPQPLYEAFNLMTNVPRVLNMQLTGYNRVYIFTGGTADVDVLPATGNPYRNTGFFINENNSPINLIGRFRVNGALQTVYVLSANTAKTYIIGSGITQDIHII